MWQRHLSNAVSQPNQDKPSSFQALKIPPVSVHMHVLTEKLVVIEPRIYNLSHLTPPPSLPPSLPESIESEEVEALRLMIQDLDMQIEGQKLKIQNTANTLLRVGGH